MAKRIGEKNIMSQTELIETELIQTMLTDTEKSKIKLSFVIPAYNEEDRLGKNLEHLQDYLHRKGINGEIIVVDDGSNDNTSEIVFRHRAKYVGYRRNRGISYAFRYGARFARGEIVLFIPADLDSPEILEDLLFPLENGSDVVQTSKRHPKSIVIGYSKSRWAFSNLWNRFIRFMFAVPYTDTDFVRAFRRSVLETILPKCRLDRAAGEPEMIVRAHRAGFKIKLIPCKIIHTDKGRVNIKFIINSVLALIKLRFWLFEEDLEKLVGFKDSCTSTFSKRL